MPRVSGPAKPHIRLVHWSDVEAPSRAKQLETAGYAVKAGPVDGKELRRLREEPPAAFVIDLSRQPSAGRDVALFWRTAKGTRNIPIVFVEGEPVKVAAVRVLLPDAIYTTWRGVRGAIRRALSPKAAAAPVVPASVLAGYSGTPLPKKLGIKAQAAVTLAGAPRGFELTLGGLPEGVKLRRRAGAAGGDLTLWFVRTSAELEHGIGRMAARIEPGGLWIVWPKKTSALASDISETEVRRAGLANGLVDYKVCAVDATWSGLKFAKRKEHARKRRRPQ